MLSGVYENAAISSPVHVPLPVTLGASRRHRHVLRARDAETPAVSINKRRRGDDETTTRATSCPSTPIHGSGDVTAQTRDASGGPEIGDSDDEDEVVSAPQRKKCRTNRTGLLRKPTTPPPRTKTKKGTLSSTISYEAAAELADAAPEVLGSAPNDAENDADVSDGDEGDESAADEDDQTMQPNEVRNPPLPSFPEEIGSLGLLALRISAPTAPSAELPVNDSDDSLFIPEEPAAAPRPAERAASTQLKGPISQATALGDVEGDENVEVAAGMTNWSGEDRRLYRHFCEDVKTAEGQ